MARYLVRPDETGWAVIDTQVEAPATADGKPQVGLPFPRAEIVASLLNWLDARGGDAAEP